MGHRRCTSQTNQVAKVVHNARIIITAWTAAHPSSEETFPRIIVSAREWRRRTLKAMHILGSPTL